MSKKNVSGVLLALVIGFSTCATAKAAEIAKLPAATKEAMAPQGVIEKTIQDSLLRLDPRLVVEQFAMSPIPGIYRVQIKDGDLFYVSEDGKHLFIGNLLNIENGQPINLTEQARSKRAAKKLAALNPEDMVIFPAEGNKKHVMYVFTDVDCGYCRKLHQEVPELNKKGVEVRYLAFPRGGQEALAYKKMVSAWCAKDRNEALNTLKSGSEIDDSTCDNPVLEQFKLGITLGVRGTPAIYLEDGQSVPGYRPAEKLLELMER